jgi:hypothetical protein
MSGNRLTFRAAEIVKRAETYAPIAMKPMCANDITPEFPEKTYKLPTTTTITSIWRVTRCITTVPHVETVNAIRANNPLRTSGG